MRLLLGKLFISKKRKAFIREFADLLQTVPKVVSVKDCEDAAHDIVDFLKKVKDNKKDRPYKIMCGQLIDYLIDTKEHIEKGYHKPAYNGWKVVTVYPNINDYIDFGYKLKSF